MTATCITAPAFSRSNWRERAGECKCWSERPRGMVCWSFWKEGEMEEEKVQELKDLLRVIAQYTRDSWVQEVIERALEDD